MYNVYPDPNTLTKLGFPVSWILKFPALWA